MVLPVCPKPLESLLRLIFVRSGALEMEERGVVMRKWLLILFFGVCFVVGAPSIYAGGEENKKPLNEVFDQMVIVPYNFQGKAFIK